jgi:hypothetical protein
MHRILVVAAAAVMASHACAQDRTVGDFRVTVRPSEATRTDDYVAAYSQRDIGFALRCMAGKQDMLLQFPGAQTRLDGARVGDPVSVQLRIDEGDILDLKASIASVVGDGVEVVGGTGEDIAQLAMAGRIGVRYRFGTGGTATSILVFNDLETIVKGVQRACRPKM